MTLFLQITSICCMLLLTCILIAWFIMFILYFVNMKKQNNILEEICNQLKNNRKINKVDYRITRDVPLLKNKEQQQKDDTNTNVMKFTDHK